MDNYNECISVVPGQGGSLLAAPRAGGSRTKVIPVIHYSSDALALRNAEIAFDAGCEGVFLIDMDHDNDLLAPVAKVIKARWPDKLVGMNFLGCKPAPAVLENITHGMDMTWTDAQPTHSRSPSSSLAENVRQAADTRAGHLVFTGVAFKGQDFEPNPGLAAQKALEFGFIPTTSGPSTGVAPDVSKVAAMRAAIGPDAPLAIASGMTPENVGEFAPYLSHILVASGVSASFHALDFEKLYRLCAIVHGGELKAQAHA